MLGLAVAGCATVGTIGSDDRQTVIDRIVAASAKVTIEQGGRRVGTGSGVVVGAQAEGAGTEAVSYVLTAVHLLDGKDGAEIFVRFTGENGVWGKFSATVSFRGNAGTLDLALRRVPGVAVPPASFADGDQVRLGEEILVVGFPWGKRLGLLASHTSFEPLSSTSSLLPVSMDWILPSVSAAAAKPATAKVAARTNAAIFFMRLSSVK